MNENDIGLLVKKLADKIKIAVDEQLKDQGLTFSQTLIIDFLAQRGGMATQKEIEDHLQVSHPTVVGIISRLEKNGFVVCSVDEKDRRNKIVRAADKSLNTVDFMRKGRQEMEERLTNGLTEGDRAEFRRIVNLMAKNL